ncbi:alternative ribosome rescue aminoacyl-tRNA hydrolase ArfB [Echinicola vietnamensis]|uniref:Protein chain release factor B n=1 Tax=Echinicola vietnamensis (strain DSM 17526 / LMG 23754 / KMM 6221) TaxID=926556 RepID=L0G2G0_ECHVK|nr:alternative ribosome rescue aminoacyl-tRNA hydrolase ArfB [Echinicola vietnamensis]AGA79181.1 protein chain release factor B [Echinicola vietnamensis DSM 17526]
MLRTADEISTLDFSSELTFKTTKSGGPGGQNVNKVNTKVQLIFDVKGSNILDDEAKEKVLARLSDKLNAEGHLQVTVQETRSQLQNKTLAVEKFQAMIKKVFERKKKRKPTKPTKAAVRKRLDHKKRRGEKKQWRRKL